MRLLILGKNPDDKGTQLEELAKQILTDMKYVELHINVTNVAGEIDVGSVAYTGVVQLD